VHRRVSVRTALLWSATSAIVALGACASDDPEAVQSAATSPTSIDGSGSGDSAAEDEFCHIMADLNSLREAPETASAEWVEQYRRAAELAPEQYRDSFELQLALLDANLVLEAAGDGTQEEQDAAYEAYMERAAELRSGDLEAAAEELAVYLTDECGIELVEQDEGAPATFTSVGRPLDAEPSD
jgi:hypothetical protein